jgi:hypothetical protein
LTCENLRADLIFFGVISGETVPGMPPLPVCPVNAFAAFYSDKNRLIIEHQVRQHLSELFFEVAI